MSKVIVDEEKCIGCGACVAINGENFEFGEEGYSKVINEVPSEKTIEAKEACPTFAIDIIEEDTSIENKLDSCDECSCGDECNCNEGDKCCDECTCGDECNCNEDDKCCDECSCHDECNCDDNCTCECKTEK